MKTPTNLSPVDGSAVNLLTILSWLGDRYAAGYLVSIQGNGLDKTFPVTEVEKIALKEIWGDWLKLDTSYAWKVASCRGSEDKLICEDEETGEIQWSDSQIFRTTGAPPINLEFEPVNEAGRIGFPLTVSWDNIPGAASYVFKIPNVKPSRTLDTSKLILPFTLNFSQGETYTADVKTCADKEGKVCGNSTAVRFTVATLNPPIITQPEAGKTEFIPSIQAKWNKVFGANAYEYQLTYTAAEPGETTECQALVGSAEKGITLSTSTVIFVRCAGQYSLQARGCVDNACKERRGWGQWSDSVIFAIQERPEIETGLIPCGRAINNPNTLWDDRKPCEIRHLFLLIKIIIDFLLFRAVPIVLVLLVLYSGIIFYFGLPMGTAEPVAKVKSLWRAAGIGLLIMFFAWTFINLFLGILGFPVGIFGNWYEIPLE